MTAKSESKSGKRTKKTGGPGKPDVASKGIKVPVIRSAECKSRPPKVPVIR